MQIDLVALVKRVGKYRAPTFTAAEIQPTGAMRDDLLRLYMRVVREWLRQWQEEIRPQYEATLAEGLRDSVNDVQGTTDSAANALNRLVVSLDAELSDWVVRTEEWHRGQFGKLFTPVGVRLDMMLGAGDVGPTLQAVLADNVSLIRSLNDQMRNGISGAVFRGLTNRTPARDVAREIRKQAGIGQRRAELIAADQLQKLTGRLDQQRQEQLGLTSFEWAHSGKLHPREYHKDRNGKVFKWDSVVGKTDPPGYAIRCGCRARAVVDLEADDEVIAAPPPPPPETGFEPVSEQRLAQRRAERAARRAAAEGPQPGVDVDALAKEAREFVLQNGRRDGVEYLTAFDARTGAQIGTNRGGVDYCELTPQMFARRADPDSRMVMHHNHPSSRSLSFADVNFLRDPGVKGIAAHGHNGSYFYAEAGEAILGQYGFDAAVNLVYGKLSDLVNAGIMTVDDANLLHYHIANLGLHRRTLLKYDYRLEGESAAAAKRHEAAIDSIVREFER